jgi:hypothetical protein
MIPTLRPRSKRFGSNPDFPERKRESGRQSNLAWLEEFAPKDARWVELLLVGGRQPIDFRLRVAQSQVRHDLSPSHWSHVCLVGDRASGGLAETEIVEISLAPSRGFGFAPPTNGIQVAALGRYRDPRAWPNIALIQVPVPREAITEPFLQVFRNRAAFDAPDAILKWLGYVWGVGSVGNPLLDGVGIPSAILVETLLGAAGFEISPAIPSRSSCPEAIWQAARWWQEYYTSDERPNARGLVGAWSTGDRLVETDDEVVRAPTRG